MMQSLQSGGPVMTEEEARALAIQMGALKPQGFQENWAAGVMSYNGRSFADTPLARSRLQAWTLAILEGRDPRQS